MKTTKTIREWLEELPEPYRTQAIGNVNKWVVDVEEPSMYRAIGSGFVWEDTPEGHEYWEELRQTYS